MDQGFVVLDKRGAGSGDQPKATVEDQIEKTVEEKSEPQPFNFAEACFNADVLGPWIAAGHFPQKYTIDGETGMVTDSEFLHPDPNLPWIMVNNDGSRECDFYRDVDKLYDVIPRPCSCCWKVVVVPRTVKELFKLLDIQIKMSREDPYCFCKCGIELRPEVERNYGGYFYCNDINQGIYRLQQVKEIVHREIDPEIKIVLKRGCTELERKYGPSNKWDDLRTPEWDAIWDRLMKVFKLTKRLTKQPTLIQKHVMMRWIAHATSIGDPSIPEINGGSSMYPGYVTYDLPKEESK